jgi:aldehyde dehydrogenase (NAD+)
VPLESGAQACFAREGTWSVEKKQLPLAERAERNSQYIGGVWQQGEGDAFPVVNPSDASTIVEIRQSSIGQVEMAIKAARTAFEGGWADMPRAERAAMLHRFVAALRTRLAAIEDMVIAEAGCPRTSPFMYVQASAPIQQADETIDFFLSLPEVLDNPVPLAERATAYGTNVQSVRRYAPVGVVAAIAAYNYPFFTAMWKVIPALVTGNTVILRPSPLTPISALFFAEAAEEAGLPAGVLSVVLEQGIAGAQLLTTHGDVDMVAFTGSTGVGKQVMTQAADTMKRLQLELGGKSAQIFLPDAWEQAKTAAAGVCSAHAGQGCAIGTRIFVPQEHKKEIIEAMAASLARFNIGETEDPATTMGPVISEAQVRRCEHFVKLAVDAGGTVAYGGKRPDGLEGFFFEPTVLDVPDNSNPAAQEEIFGPVLCVIGYSDVDHAVAMANDSPYGLSGYVYGKDRVAALNVAGRLRTGTVNVNGGLLSAYVSSGGHRLSGIGRERGEEGLRLYQNITCLNIGC